MVGRKFTVIQRTPRGFSVPCFITQELRDFLTNARRSSNLGPMITRKEVMHTLNYYIMEHDLRDPNDSFKILFLKDPALTKIIKLPAGQILTYYNLHTATKDCFRPLTIP